jgi:hypothetical protein
MSNGGGEREILAGSSTKIPNEDQIGGSCNAPQ